MDDPFQPDLAEAILVLVNSKPQSPSKKEVETLLLNYCLHPDHDWYVDNDACNFAIGEVAFRCACGASVKETHAEWVDRQPPTETNNLATALARKARSVACGLRIITWIE